MTLLQLIAHLKEIYDEEGNLEVWLSDMNGSAVDFGKDQVFAYKEKGANDILILSPDITVIPK